MFYIEPYEMGELFYNSIVVFTNSIFIFLDSFLIGKFL